MQRKPKLPEPNPHDTVLDVASEDLPFWRVVEAMSKEQRRELNEYIEDECQAARKEAWNAAVEQIAEGLELEIDNRTARANRIRELKDILPISSPQRTRRTK